MRSRKIRRWNDRIASAGDRAFWQFLEKLNIHWLYNSGILISRYLLKKIKTHVHTKPLTQMSVVQLLRLVPLFAPSWNATRQTSLSTSVYISIIHNSQNKKGKQPNFRCISISTDGILLSQKTKRTELLIHKTARINLKNIHKVEESVKVLVAQSCPILCHRLYCRLPGSSVHGIA